MSIQTPTPIIIRTTTNKYRIKEHCARHCANALFFIFLFASSFFSIAHLSANEIAEAPDSTVADRHFGRGGYGKTGHPPVGSGLMDKNSPHRYIDDRMYQGSWGDKWNGVIVDPNYEGNIDIINVEVYQDNSEEDLLSHQ